MTKTEFIKWAKSRGWIEDRWGHLQKISSGTKYRFYISKISIRHEYWLETLGEWHKLRSGYLKDLSITPEGKLTGMKK